MAVFDPKGPYAQAIIIDTDKFQEFWREVKTVDKELSKQLRRAVTRAVRPITLEVRAAALAIPTKGGSAAKAYRSRGTRKPVAGLRQGLAMATEQKIAFTNRGDFAVRIRVSGSKFAQMTHKTRTLPRYMEGLGRRFQNWRHPVFIPYKELPGPPGSWIEQDQHPFLLPTVNKHRQEVLRAIEYAFETAMRSIGFK